MTKQKSNRKTWSKPAVQTLKIRKDTSSGLTVGPEGAGRKGPPGPPGRS